ncbi:GNAT family N-acetyltransferase [Murimonas intestini]|uniref:GNAT family N-acetyltransferase n=1 Tax=Murimonas intestini TaxID=1337051 RepID=UPI0011DCA93D|nr:GNAT family N-acetyltransferase [Murimonas intestini]
MGYEIRTLSVLDDRQKAEIEALEDQIYGEEGLQNRIWLSSELNFDRKLDCFFMGYEDGLLVSFLNLFMPDKREGEVTGFTRTGSRGRGYFTALLDRAGEVLRSAGVPDFLFAVEPASPAGMKYLQGLGTAEHSHTEYTMECGPSYAPLGEGIILKQLSEENTADFMSVAEEEYGSDGGGAAAILASETREGYILYDGSEPAAIFNLEYGENIYLCGVVVKKAMRGLGYGSQAVRAALNMAEEQKKKVVLDVDSKNPPALNLYRKYGFAPVFEVRYFRQRLQRGSEEGRQEC